MGSKPPANTTSTVQPWSGAQPYYKDLYSTAQAALNATPRQAYQGDLYAGPNNMQTQALDMFRQASTSAGTGADQVRQLALDTIGGKYMHADSNPYLSGAVEAANRGVYDQLTRQIIPGIQDQSIANGAYGGSGNGVATGIAMGDYARSALDTSNRIYAANYAQERQNQLNTAPLFQTATDLSLLPAKLLDMAGTQQQSWEQAALDAELQRYQMAQAAPWAGLGEYSQILNGGGFNTTTGTAPGASRAASALQGGFGAAAGLQALNPNASNGLTALMGLLGAGAGAWG